MHIPHVVRPTAPPRLLAGLLAGGIAIALAGCGSPERARIAVSMQDMSQPFAVALVDNLRDEAGKLDVDLLVMDGRANADKQRVDLESARVQQMDGVLLLPRDATVVPAVQALLDAGIPATSVARRPDGLPPAVGYVGADNLGIGAALADWVIKQYPQGARVALLTGTAGSSPAVDRERGLRERLGGAGVDYPLVLAQAADWQRGKALQVMQAFIAQHPVEEMPQVILAGNDEMALGALDALRAAHRDQLGIAILGCDASPAVLRLIRDGAMAASVEQSASGQARTALRTLVARIHGDGAAAAQVVAPVLITAANLQQAEHAAAEY